MDQPEQKSNKIVWIIIGAVVAVAVIVGVVIYFVLNAGADDQTAQSPPSPSASPAVSVATKEEVKQNLAELQDSIKQAQADQATAKAALKDSSNQIKVGN